MTFKSPLRTLFPGMRARFEAVAGALWAVIYILTEDGDMLLSEDGFPLETE